WICSDEELSSNTGKGVPMILDRKVVFYLKNQKQIDEWYSLRARAIAETHEFFCSIAPDVKILAAKLGNDVMSVADIENPYPKIYLYRQNWHDENLGYPTTGIALEWYRKNVSFMGSDRAYMGVWVNPDKAYEKFKPILFEAIEKVAPKSKFIGQYTSWLPFYRYEEPKAENYWENLEVYKAQLLSSFEEQWNLFWETIDIAVQQYRKMK
ncbi:MAG: hypothetical protein Q8O74_07760, partial [bacterium]|nr:hypothetical protein [bacterium]